MHESAVEAGRAPRRPVADEADGGAVVAEGVGHEARDSDLASAPRQRVEQRRPEAMVLVPVADGDRDLSGVGLDAVVAADSDDVLAVRHNERLAVAVVDGTEEGRLRLRHYGVRAEEPQA